MSPRRKNYREARRNHCLRNLNQELEEQIKDLKEDKKSQLEKFEKIQSNNILLKNKLQQLQKEVSKLSPKHIQVKYLTSKFMSHP